MNLKRHRKSIERLYTDRCTIYRYEDVKDPVTKETKQILQQLYDNLPCRISQRALGQNNQTAAQNEINYETKLFIGPEIEIKQGDLFEVTRGNVIRRYTAGEPFLYPTHLEVSIKRKEWA